MGFTGCCPLWLQNAKSPRKMSAKAGKLGQKTIRRSRGQSSKMSIRTCKLKVEIPMQKNSLFYCVLFLDEKCIFFLFYKRKSLYFFEYLCLVCFRGTASSTWGNVCRSKFMSFKHPPNIRSLI